MVHGLVKERGSNYGEDVGQPGGSSERLDPLERVRASFERQGLMRLLRARGVTAGRRLFVCRSEVSAVAGSGLTWEASGRRIMRPVAWASGSINA